MKMVMKWILKKQVGGAIDSAVSGQVPAVKSCEHCTEVPLKTRNFLNTIATISFSKRTLLLGAS
jgi:hypothetical protein